MSNACGGFIPEGNDVFYRMINSTDHLNQKIRWPKLKCKSDRIMQSIDNDQIETEKDKWNVPNFMNSLKTGFMYIENQVWSHLKRSHSIEWTPSNQQQDEEEEEKKRSTTNSELIYTSKQWTVQHRLKWNQTKLVYTFLLIVWFCIRAIFSARVPSIAFHLALCLCVCVCVFLTWQLNTRACLRSHSNSSFDFAWTIHHFVHRYKVVIHILRNILYFIYIYIDIFIQKCALFIWSSPIWNAANKTSLATAMRKTHSTTTIYGMVYGLRSKPPIVFRALLFLYVSILHRQWRRCSFEMKNTK